MCSCFITNKCLIIHWGSLLVNLLCGLLICCYYSNVFVTIYWNSSIILLILWKCIKVMKLQWEFQLFWALSEQVCECGNHPLVLWSWDRFLMAASSLVFVFGLSSFPFPGLKSVLLYIWSVAFFKKCAIFHSGINQKVGSNKLRALLWMCKYSILCLKR